MACRYLSQERKKHSQAYSYVDVKSNRKPQLTSI